MCTDWHLADGGGQDQQLIYRLLLPVAVVHIEDITPAPLHTEHAAPVEGSVLAKSKKQQRLQRGIDWNVIPDSRGGSRGMHFSQQQ